MGNHKPFCGRYVQQAILQVIEKVIDPTFSECSFGFRPQIVRQSDVWFDKEGSLGKASLL